MDLIDKREENDKYNLMKERVETSKKLDKELKEDRNNNPYYQVKLLEQSSLFYIYLFLF